MADITGVGLGINLPRINVPAASPAEAPEADLGVVATPDLPASTKIAADAGEVITPRDWAQQPAPGELEGVNLDAAMLRTMNDFTAIQAEVASLEAQAIALVSSTKTGPLRIPPNPAQLAKQAATDAQVDAAIATLLDPTGTAQPIDGPLPQTDPLIAAAADAAAVKRDAGIVQSGRKGQYGLQRAHQMLLGRKERLTGNRETLKHGVAPLIMAVSLTREALSKATDPNTIRRLTNALAELGNATTKLTADISDADLACNTCEQALGEVVASLSEIGIAG